MLFHVKWYYVFTTARVEIALPIQFQINSGIQESFVDTLEQVMKSEVRIFKVPS